MGFHDSIIQLIICFDTFFLLLSFHECVFLLYVAAPLCQRGGTYIGEWFWMDCLDNHFM